MIWGILLGINSLLTLGFIAKKKEKWFLKMGRSCVPICTLFGIWYLLLGKTGSKG